jgi:hypothetical protein
MNESQGHIKRQGVRKWIGRSAGALMALGLGAWISLQLWPHWIDFRDRQPAAPDAAPPVQPAFVPPPAPDKQTSMLGTDASLSEKPMQLVLVATSPAAALTDSTATLGTDPRNPQTYAGGAILANGARIEEVHADRIVLGLKGRRSTLTIDRESASRVAMSAAVSDKPSFLEGKVGDATSIGGRSRAMQETIATSREDLSEFLRPQPVFENDRFAGLKILAGTSPGKLAALGVEPGDVIRSVEGKFIESADAWQEIDDTLSAGGSIVVGVERNGSLMSISLDGRRLASDAPIG